VRERLAALDGIPLDLPEEERELALMKLLFSARSSLTLVLVGELLGDKTRINLPGTVGEHNWTWRLPKPIEELREDAALGARFDAIRALVAASGRLESQ
jgi:4-alpha-glucanotransferase